MLISNPAASPLFLPVVGSLGGLLAAALAALALVERGRLAESVLFRRWRTWAVIAPVYVLGVLSGPLVAVLFVGALSLLALREYAALVGLPGRYRGVLLAVGLLPAAAVLLGNAVHAALPALALLAATLPPLLRDVLQSTPSPSIGGATTQSPAQRTRATGASRPATERAKRLRSRAERAGGAGGGGQPGQHFLSLRHAAVAAFGWLYLPWLLSYLLLIQRDVPGGAETLLALGLAVALGDVGAFVGGKLVGGWLLAPTISPNKTWGGVGGTVLGVALGLLLLRRALPASLGDAALAGLALVVSVGAVWGDLVESLLKRACGVKDAGAWLPGFGGLLDRLDSLVIVLPLSYYFLRMVTS
jgi:phosphatidate cytidylyltransferase